MNLRYRRRTTLLLVASLALGLSCACPPSLARYYPFAESICLEAPYSPPASALQESDLVGTWEARYRGGVDTLTIRDEDTFKQVYRDQYEAEYLYETAWNEWWLERRADGRVRIHLQGARYYPRGIRTAELDGLGAPTCPTSSPGCTGKPFPLPYPFVDPFTRDRVDMVQELVLNIRVDSAGQLLLHHMFYHGDEGFVISGCGSYHFRRVEAP
jgi:hypothetical protein